MAPYRFTLTGIGTNTTGTFSGVPAGTYSTAVTDAQGCRAATGSVTIVRSAPVTVAIANLVNAGCSNPGSVQLSATNGRAPYRFQIGNLPANTSGTFTGLAAGTYPVWLTDANGCTATCAAVVINNICNRLVASSNDKATSSSTDGSFNVYPNPFSDKASVEFRLAQAQNYSLELYDAKGSLVTRIAAGAAEAGKYYSYQVQSQNLPEGIYLVRLSAGKASQSFRIRLSK